MPIVPFLTRKWSFYFDLNVPILTIPIFHLTKAASSDYVQSKSEKLITLQSPCGYKFEVSKATENVTCGVRLASSDLERTKRFWCSLAKMSGLIEGNKLTLKYDNSEIWMEFIKVDQVTPGDNYGRTALAWPTSGLKKIEESANEFNGSVLTPYLTLPTPGKEGVILFTFQKMSVTNT